METDRYRTLRLRRGTLDGMAVALLLYLCVGLSVAEALPVPLQNATATFSQTFTDPDFLVSMSIDGSLAAPNGWAIAHASAAAQTFPEAAVYETVSDLGSSTLTFKLTQTSVVNHTLGRFLLYATTDSRGNFADGLQSGGQIGSIWTVLDPLTFSSSAGGDIITELGDNSLLLSPAAGPSAAVYTITANAPFNGITGFRLDVLADGSLPDSGPGRAFNGNFVLTEFEVDAVPLAVALVPEPSSLLLLATAGLVILARGRCRRGKPGAPLDR